MDPTSIFGALGLTGGDQVAGAPMNLSGAIPAPGATGAGGQPNYAALMQTAQKLLALPKNPGMQPMQMPQPLGMLNRSY